MKRFQMKKLNNDGAALVFAIVIVMFVTILTTLLLYLSAMNYEMKTTDYRTKVSFYGAEIPLEELRVQMAVDVANASEVAYEHVMLNYGALGTQDMRATEYQKIFFQEIERIWDGRDGTPNNGVTDWRVAIHSALQNNAAYEVRFASDTPSTSNAWQITLSDALEDVTMFGGVSDSDDRIYQVPSQGRIVIQNVGVSYTQNNFLSMINTDICITVPEFDWSVNEANVAYPGTYQAGDEERKKINFEECVYYMRWTKQ